MFHVLVIAQMLLWYALQCNNLNFRDKLIPQVSKVSFLEVTFDQSLNSKAHVTNVVDNYLLY